MELISGDYILIAARILKTDFRYFISDALDELEKETRQVFRALDAPSPADRLAIRRFMLFCLGEAELEELLSQSRPQLPPTYPRPQAADYLHKDQGKRAASQERERLSLGNLPIQNVFDVIRRQGVRLSRHALTDASLSGLTVIHPSAGVSILINHEEDLYRQFFSAAHEYGHVLFDRPQLNKNGCIVSYQSRRQDLVEVRANAFAAEFLLPSTALAKYSRPRSLDEVTERIEQVARDYRVNTDTVAIRTKDVGWITDKTLESFRKVKPIVIRRVDKTDPDVPAKATPSQTSRYESAAERGISTYYLELLRRGVTEDAISFGRFAEMLDMTPDEAREFVHATGLAF
jgi:Zn-dependent peptidase ImmA (M78 family)